MMKRTSQTSLRLAVHNCENLFVYMDHWKGQDVFQLNEAEWQALSSATVKNKPLRKLKWLAETIEDIDADIIGLNEVGGRESLDNFNRFFLKEAYHVYLVEGNSDRGIDIGYLVKKTLPGKFVLLSHRQRPIQFLYPHEDPNKTLIKSHFFSRDVAELRWFAPNMNQPQMIFLLVHLKSKLDPQNIDPQGQLRRAAELKTLIEIYKEVRLETQGTPVIVAGDFNTDHELAPLREQTDLIEAFRYWNRPIEEIATQVNFPRNGKQQFIKIDHVFVSPELTSSLLSDQTFVHLFRSDLGMMLPYAQTFEQRTALPSDHYPMVVSFNESWTSFRRP